MESLEAVRKKITELEQEAAQAKKDGDKVLYSALRGELAALRAEKVLLMKQGVLRLGPCERRGKISLWDQTESQRGWPSNGCGRSH